MISGIQHAPIDLNKLLQLGCWSFVNDDQVNSNPIVKTFNYNLTPGATLLKAGPAFLVTSFR